MQTLLSSVSHFTFQTESLLNTNSSSVL